MKICNILRMYRAMFHLSPEPMALLGLDARFWDVNQALADMVRGLRVGSLLQSG
jgi:hypothetical protein